jgi:hypothetical protein
VWAIVPIVDNVPPPENDIAGVVVAAVRVTEAAKLADAPTPNPDVIIQLAVVTPCTTPLVFVALKLQPLSSENDPPATMPLPTALETACTVRESLTKTVLPLTNATSPGPGTTPPDHVAGKEKSLLVSMAGMLAIGYTFSLMNA